MRKFGYLFLFIAALSLFLTGCAKTQDQNAAQNPASPDASAAADGNLAPVSDTSASAQPAAAPQPGDSAGAYQDVADNSGQAVYAPEAPPPLPDYSQPPSPGDNYEWSPGYWGYANAGYYWVPGAWILAPYVDALWTPPYWEFDGGRYRWHSGYWGDHIGYYGGVNYGFGYTGQGYYGGYWNGGSFAYNRSVTNVNVNVVHNVYERSVPNARNSNRVSYNGGPGGINARPVPAELAALRERHTPPVAAQQEHIRTAASDRAQLASVNRGRPTLVAQAQPLPTSYRAPAGRPSPAEQPMPVGQNGRPEIQPQQPGPVQQPLVRQPVPARPQAVPERSAPERPAPAARPGVPEQRPVQQPQARQPVPAARPATAPRQAIETSPARNVPREPQPPARPAAPEPRPAQQPQARQPVPARPQAAPERPAPARPVPAARPQPAARPAAAPRPAPASKPAPKPEEKPEDKKRD